MSTNPPKDVVEVASHGLFSVFPNYQPTPMKLPTSYQYRHVFLALAFLGIGLLCYGVVAMSYPVAWSGILLTFANGITLQNLED